MAYDPAMRASDVDRDRVAERLREAHAEGRLSLEEFQARLDAAIRARTYGDLEPLLRDLPAPYRRAMARGGAPRPARPPARRGPGAPPTRQEMHTALSVLWTLYSVAVAVSLVVWVLVALFSADLFYFWPAWVAGPAGAALAAVTYATRRRD